MRRLRGLFSGRKSESDAAIYPIDHGGNMMGALVRREPAATHSAVIARLDRAIQYAAADMVRANSSTLASGILDRPVEAGR
ncbi:hypothetical protein EAS56_21020 [Bradyrhizobium guangzhouense]|uniref:IclR-ED domain-containing protein n=1 Tax=Bradyrhizobium guangzhouense TaxID=1325095 RepID=A0ABY0E5H2_9BRAD|nr:hypothetical protein EAS56_21020 [Bradyrhizobium guangzhouense]